MTTSVHHAMLCIVVCAWAELRLSAMSPMKAKNLACVWTEYAELISG